MLNNFNCCLHADESADEKQEVINHIRSKSIMLERETARVLDVLKMTDRARAQTISDSAVPKWHLNLNK